MYRDIINQSHEITKGKLLCFSLEHSYLIYKAEELCVCPFETYAKLELSPVAVIALSSIDGFPLPNLFIRNYKKCQSLYYFIIFSSSQHCLSVLVAAVVFDRPLVMWFLSSATFLGYSGASFHEVCRSIDLTMTYSFHSVEAIFF